MKYIISLSGGRDSAAVGIWFCKNLPTDCESAHFITADTGEENRNNFGFYDFLNVYDKKIIKPAGFSLDIVRAPLNGKETAWRGEYFMEGKECLPGFFQQSCSDKLKVRPMRKWRKEKFGDTPLTWLIGYRADEGKESRRVQPEKTISSGDIYWKPFLKLGYKLADVQRIMKEAGVPEPGLYKWSDRSGCSICFHKSLRSIRNALKFEPENYAAMEANEEACMRRNGERRAQADYYVDRVAVFDKKGDPIIKRNGRAKMKIIHLPKKPLKPGNPMWDVEVRFFGRKASPWVAQYKMTLREIREAEESQLDLDFSPDIQDCSGEIPACGI